MLIKEEMESLSFSPAESVTVAYLLENADQLENMSIQAVAKATYTQASTIVRIAKKLGFKGWVDFKKAFLSEHAYLSRHFTKVDSNIPFEAGDSPLLIASKIGHLEQSTIEDLLSLLQQDYLQEAQNLLVAAQVIYIFGQSANLLIAEDFALKLRRLGRLVHVVSTLGEERYEAHNMSPGAIALLLSTSGETQPILNVAKIARIKKVKTIGITSIGNNRLSKQVDLFLPITTREKLYSKIGNFSSNIAIHVLLDILYSLVFASSYDQNLQHIKVTGQKIDLRNSATLLMEED